MKTGTNAHSKPQFEGQIVKFNSPHNSHVILFDIAKYNENYGCLEWHALNEPTQAQINDAFWSDFK